MADKIINSIEAGRAIKGFGEELAQPIIDYRAAQEAEKKLLENLGEWASRVKRNGRYYHPLLSLEKFKIHCYKHKCHFKVIGECNATFGWAHLLYALNIRPEDEIVGWKVVTEEESPVVTRDIHLEMPAEVLWHIINIFRLYAKPDLRGRQNEENRYRLPFGVVTFEERAEKEMIAARFDLTIGTISKENEVTNYPFPIHQYNPFGGDRLKFREEQVMDDYLLAISTGISKLELAVKTFDYPDDPERVLVERGKQLVALLKALRLSSTSAWNNPYLVTKKWLEDAGKIYRRITSNKGEYVDLPRDFIAAIKGDSSIAKVFDDQLKRTMNWEKKGEDILRSRVLLPGKEIQFSWEGALTGPTDEAILLGLISHYLPSALETFKNEARGSLKHTLFSMKEDACYLFTMDPIIRNSPGVLLEFSPEHRLWGFDCVVK